MKQTVTPPAAKADSFPDGQQKDSTTNDSDDKTTSPVHTAAVHTAVVNNDGGDKPADSATPNDPANGAAGDWNSAKTPADASRQSHALTIVGDKHCTKPETTGDENADKVVAEKSNNVIRFMIKLFDWMRKKGRSVEVRKQILSQHWITRFVIKIFGWMQKKKGRSVEVPKQTRCQWCQHCIDLAFKSSNASASLPDPASAPSTASATALVSSPPFAGPPPVAASASGVEW